MDGHDGGFASEWPSGLVMPVAATPNQSYQADSRALSRHDPVGEWLVTRDCFATALPTSDVAASVTRLAHNSAALLCAHESKADL
jgi:hypothetical protein